MTHTTSQPEAGLPDGAVYVQTIERVERGEVRRALPLGSASITRPGRVTLELHRLILGDVVVELDTPLAVTVALSGAACSALARGRDRAAPDGEEGAS